MVIAIILVEAGVKLEWMLSGTGVVAVANSGVAILQTQLCVESMRTSNFDDSLAVEEIFVRIDMSENVLEVEK